MDYPILSKINSPDDVKQLDSAQTQNLCEEIRDCIINTVSKNGGHLASNLGTVELTVALHKAFSSPKDAIIFDVGHQCYTHKLITGRFKEFDTLRTKGGISGFMNPFESEHDAVISGHSSCSISAAYGIYKAKRIAGEDGTAVAVIGDGALTGGMAYEALNNAGSGRSNFIVVLNDNKMSISKNVGALSRSLTKMRNKPKYHKFKFAFSSFLLKVPLIGKWLHNIIFSIKEGLKEIVYRKNIFSSLGYNYLGPVDGHNIPAMESLFKIAQGYTRPSLIHVVTTKGKGYSFAETSPKNYHGVSPFNIEEGADLSNNNNFSAIAGKTLSGLAAADDKICAITAAMTEGTGLADFAKDYKPRFFDVGIAEAHAVTFAAGLAKGGLKPYFVVYSSFLQRAYDQIVHDVATANLPVRLLVDRAGIVGEDGITHQGLLDVSYLTSIPNISIYSPATFEELEYRIKLSAADNEFTAIRYPRGAEKTCLPFDKEADFDIIKGNVNKAIITYGRLFSEASAVKEKTDINIVKLNKIYPLPNILCDELNGFGELHFFEESEKSGGIAEHLSAMLLENGYKGKFIIHAVENKFVPTNKVTDALKEYGLDAEAMLKAVSD
ncbi:MAG: 1-deoxy-D-xylulose-5-phosphate synthase [Clostridia bacterium]|nr:1-deoxy-D-xylulose-5-phosphate synthase [Clostridia bacterium]